MKHQADKKRAERVFQVGDWVYLKLQPYVQTSVAQRPSQKLGFRFFGPFEVLKRVGNVSYKLKLLDNARVHPVIHVSQLKKSLRPGESASSTLPVALMQDAPPAQPQAIEETRMVRRGVKMVPQVRLSWSGCPSSYSTWEHLYTMIDIYPQAPAWGQAGSAGAGIVTTQLLPKALHTKQRACERRRRKEAQEQKQSKPGPSSCAE